MRNRFLSVTLMLILSVVLVLSGCSSKKEPKEALQNAAENALKMDSYALTNHIKIKDLSFNFANENTQQVSEAIQMLKNAELNITQVYQKDPTQIEATFEIKLQGDVATTITVPFVLTKDKFFVKIPSVPFFPLPESVVGKFLEVDLKELAAQSGTEFNPDTINMDKSHKLVSEIFAAVFAEYDSAKYFKDIDAKEAGVPSDVETKQVVQFNVTNDNVKDAITTLVNKVAPKVLDILNKEEYRSMLKIESSEIEEAKKQLAEGDQGELSKGLDEMKKYLKINKFHVNTGISKKDYPVYQGLDADLEFNNPETSEKVRIAFEMTSTYTKINEKADFKIGIPTDTITIEELGQAFNALGQ